MQTSKYTQPWMLLKKKFNVGQQQSIACGSIHFWQAQNGSLFMVECGPEIWPFKIQKQWNLDFWIAYVKETSFEGSSYSCGHDYLKTGFKWSMTILWPFVRISNAQIPFEIWTICKQTSFRLFEIWACQDFRSPLQYWKLF